MGKRVDGAELYRRFTAHGLIYGPAFQGVAEVWAGKNEALGRIVAPAAIASRTRRVSHSPGLARRVPPSHPCDHSRSAG